MYKIKIFLEDIKAFTLLLGALLYVQASLSQTASNTLLGERTRFRMYCKEYLSSCSLDSPKDISKALWLISAFNQRGENVEGFLNRLSVCYDSLELRQQFDFISLLKERKFDAKEVLLRKAFKSENNKLSLLAYSILNETGEGICNDRNYGLDWDNINTQIKEKNYKYELSQSELTKLMEYAVTKYSQKYHLFVLVRENRNIPAKVYVVNSNGKVLNKKPLYYLARSANNTLPYFTNGNTPCGVFKIQGKSVSNNVYIGPVTTLVTELPFESEVTAWGIPGKEWTENMYASFLPLELRSLPMLWQAYDAGRVGRSEIIVHGSTIDPCFFSEECFFPLTPSLGCLSAFEIWNPNDGSIMESHQKSLMELLPDDRSSLGFMYVVQVDESAYRLF